MSAKKSVKTTIVPDRIDLNAETKKLPEVKALLKKLAEVKEKEEIGKKLTPIVEFAAKTLEQKFKSWSQVVRYVEKIDKGSKRAERLTDSQMKKIEEMKAANKSVKEISTELKCKDNQVRVFLKKLESGK